METKVDHFAIKCVCVVLISAGVALMAPEVSVLLPVWLVVLNKIFVYGAGGLFTYLLNPMRTPIIPGLNGMLAPLQAVQGLSTVTETVKSKVTSTTDTVVSTVEDPLDQMDSDGDQVVQDVADKLRDGVDSVFKHNRGDGK